MPTPDELQRAIDAAAAEAVGTDNALKAWRVWGQQFGELYAGAVDRGAPEGVAQVITVNAAIAWINQTFSGIAAAAYEQQRQAATAAEQEATKGTPTNGDDQGETAAE